MFINTKVLTRVSGRGFAIRPQCSFCLCCRFGCQPSGKKSVEFQNCLLPVNLGCASTADRAPWTKWPRGTQRKKKGEKKEKRKKGKLRRKKTKRNVGLRPSSFCLSFFFPSLFFSFSFFSFSLFVVFARPSGALRAPKLFVN